MYKKKKGSAHIITLCLMGLVLLFLYLLAGLTQLQLEYDTAVLNEAVSEAVLAADYMDQYMAAARGCIVFDCSPLGESGCSYRGCLYESGSEEHACSQAFEKARERFRESLSDALSLHTDFAVTGNTPCGIKQIEIKEFRTYSVMEQAENGFPGVGRTYMKTLQAAQWYDYGHSLSAPNGEPILTSGIYVDVEFTVKTFLKTTKLPVRTFVGIRK